MQPNVEAMTDNVISQIVDIDLGNIKIALVTPPLPSSQLYKEWDLSGVDSVSPPLGILFLAGIVRKHGGHATIHDAFARRMTIGEVVQEVVSEKSDVIGISCMTPSFPQAKSLIEALKKEAPEIPLVLGGPHITAMPLRTLADVPELDIGVVREGEATIVDLLDAIKKGRPLSEVRGLVLRDNDKVFTTAQRPFIKNLDYLAYPAWDLLPSLLDPYHVSIIGSKGKYSTSLLTSRGCPGRCTFCDVGGVGRKIRGFSAGYVLGMIEHLVNHYGINDFIIYDDNFVSMRKRLKTLCWEIVRRSLNIHFSCCARVDQVNPEIISLMKQAGCWQIEYGIESGSQRILDLMQKNITLAEIEQALRWTKEAGIETRGNFIFGFPGETRQTLDQSLNFALKLELDYFQQTFLTPYPGSAIYDVAEDYGLFDRNFEDMNNMIINFIPHGLTKDELENFSSKAFRRFYLRPKVIWHHLKKLGSWQDLQRLMIAFWAFMKTIFRRHKTGNLPA